MGRGGFKWGTAALSCGFGRLCLRQLSFQLAFDLSFVSTDCCGSVAVVAFTVGAITVNVDVLDLQQFLFGSAGADPNK